MVLDVLAEPGVLLPVARKDGDEPALPVGDMVKVGAGAQLAVRHVEEVRAPGQLAEGLPGLDVGGVVVGVSIA